MMVLVVNGFNMSISISTGISPGDCPWTSQRPKMERGTASPTWSSENPEVAKSTERATWTS